MTSIWNNKSLREICKIIYGKPFDSSHFNCVCQGTPLIRIRDIARGYSETYTTEPFEKEYFVSNGDLLIGMDGEFKISEWNGGGACLNQRVCKLIPDGNMMLSHFLLYCLNDYLKRIENEKGFSTVKHLSARDLNSIIIPLPPIAEQQRIVGILDAAFEKIDTVQRNAERNLANAKELFQRVLDEEMTPKDGWNIAQIKDFAEVKIGPFGSLLHKSDYIEKGIPIINPCHMRNNSLDDYISQQVSISKADELSSYKLQENDIVFARRGDIGRCALIRTHEAGYLCGTGSLFVRIKNSILAPFLFLVAQNSSFVSALEKTSTGTTMSSINVNSVAEMVTSFPSIEKQKSILTNLSIVKNCVNKIEWHNMQIQKICAGLKQQILTKAFNGEL